VQGDAHALPFRNEAFGMIVCFSVLEHLADLWQALREVWRILKDDGVLIGV